MTKLLSLYTNSGNLKGGTVVLSQTTSWNPYTLPDALLAGTKHHLHSLTCTIPEPPAEFSSPRPAQARVLHRVQPTPPYTVQQGLSGHTAL